MRRYLRLEHAEIRLSKCELTRSLVLSPFTLEIWNRTPSKSATVMSIDSGLCLESKQEEKQG